VIAHVVLFTPKKDLSSDQLLAFATTMAGCFRSIDSIERVSVGRHAEIQAGYDREFGDQTYEYGAVLEFRNAAGLIDYLRHPLHHELGRLFWETCERTVISELEMHDGRAPAVVELFLNSQTPRQT
jgi:hypothetical protein